MVIRFPFSHPQRCTLLGCVLLLCCGQAQAISFSFPFGDRSEPRPPPGWQFRPQGPSNARGVPPAGYPMQPRMPTGWGSPYPPNPSYPTWQGQRYNPYPQPRRTQAPQPPRLEIEVSDQHPYVQENILLTLRVISDRNLATATPEFPSTNDFLFRKLTEPRASIRTGAEGQNEIVNKIVYILTPLRPGTLDLPPISVSGEIAGNAYYGGSQRYKATSGEQLSLQVRPAMRSVRPWLPLQDLSLRASLDAEGEVEEGQPVTLMLELRALGATGSQLPSLEPYLKSPDFRVYREQTLTEGKLSSDGKRIQGRRTEYYTLVPRSGGRLHLPEIRIPWWNVEQGRREYATLPVRLVQAKGESAPFGLSMADEDQGRSSGFWLPLLGLGLVLLGYWGGVWYRGWREGQPVGETPLLDQLRTGVKALGAQAQRNLARALGRLHPGPALDRLRQKLMPAQSPEKRFLRCVRQANRESDPAAWAKRFQETTCRQLNLAIEPSLPGMVGQILALRPGADRAQIERLMQQLDAALYGGQDIDFQRWKKAFSREVHRRQGFWAKRRSWFQRPRLPELNPRFSD